VTVTATGFPLICGQVTGLLKVTFPPAAQLPRAIPPAAVRVNGRPASAVTVAKRTISVIVPRKPGLTCLSIVLGKVTIAFAPRAHVVPGTARKATVARAPRTYAARVAAF
jgi:hypothetical protein